MSPNSGPLEVAHRFLRAKLRDGGGFSNASSYKIRKDSYTDPNTGVTHVYVRQMMHGLEVVNGDINVNIRNGRILSYGNSVSWVHT